MGRRWWVVGAAAAAVVLAVLLVRPGTQASSTDVAAPGTAAPGTAAPVPQRSAAATTSPLTTFEPLTRPLELGARVLADVAPSATGAGPLVLGAPEEQLVASGWTTRPGQGDCRRVREATTRTGDVLTGWVRDGRLVSVQVTSGHETLELPDLGTGFGLPVAEVRRADRIAVNDAEGEPVVTTTATVADGVVAVASDLGTDRVRWVEVRLVEGGGCALDTVTADASSGGDVIAAAHDPHGTAGDDAVADLEPLLGAAPGDEMLRSAGLGALPAEDPSGCARVGLSGEEPGEVGARWVDIADGTVVRAGRTLVTAGAPDDSRPTLRPLPGGADGEVTVTTWQQRWTSSYRADGLVVETDHRVLSWVPPDVDVLVPRAPVLRAAAVALQRDGVALGCSGQLP